ncbi:hypothetical protein OG555_08390 [Kribbella sp. NBC_01484]|uniref:hypothetical protein n=1 Tax=Kribbella sp. NBC_01484 TaxID=2903579 RepID=UPI002E33A4DA|nr:hypothetical protein [Kribbella sp. NBC_01484]
MAGPDGDWLDLARVHALTFKPPGWKSDRSIRLIWADAEAVLTEFATNRGPGYVSVVGTWRDESIEVEEQSPDIPAREPRADFTDPPCPPPPGGWRHDALVFGLDYGDLASSGAMVTRVIFRPSAGQEVLVVATTDVDAVTQQLSPQLQNQLCVVPSRFTRAQLDEVRDVLLARWREWRIETFDTRADAQAQPFIRAELFRVTAEMADWADSLPDGLLRLRPALSPA